jgi:hypothetical protein
MQVENVVLAALTQIIVSLVGVAVRGMGIN